MVMQFTDKSKDTAWKLPTNNYFIQPKTLAIRHTTG